jgi:hypothetical protein
MKLEAAETEHLYFVCPYCEAMAHCYLIKPVRQIDHSED